MRALLGRCMANMAGTRAFLCPQSLDDGAIPPAVLSVIRSIQKQAEMAEHIHRITTRNMFRP